MPKSTNLLRLEARLTSATDKLGENLHATLPELHGELCTGFNAKVVELLRDYLTVEAQKIKERRDAQGN